ncbi:MAG: hypothetical protein RBR02_11285, partial [Desulfuromonadaceae bacterium]|nr:hypothetical protein [Desulfuromonadaceae bacterium]
AEGLTDLDWLEFKASGGQIEPAVLDIIQNYIDEAEANQKTADSYATEAEDTFVKVYTSNGDGTFTATDTAEYSALHWRNKTAGLLATKADLNGDPLEVFEVADATTATQAVNKGQLDTKQDTLISGTNIKTLAGATLLGSGNFNEITQQFNFKAASDTATLGAELTTNGTFTGNADGWTLGTGWAYGTDNVVLTLTGGGEGTLSQNISVTSGLSYYITWSQTHSIANNAIITPSIDGVSGIATSFGNTSANNSAMIITANATGSIPLTFTPSGTASGTVTIDTVSIKQITPITAVLNYKNMAGSIVSQLRVFSASSNTANGVYALLNNTTGTSNTANGVNALASNTTGINNTANGVYALLNNTTGINNTANGVYALLNNTTGTSNTANGFSALQNNTTGINNTANGVNALASNTTGINNTANGVNALASNTTGINNTANGINAGRYIADGTTPSTIQKTSVFIGANTKPLADNQTDQIVIGNSAIGHGSHTVTIGNSTNIANYITGKLNIANIPTSSVGLSSGDIWSNSGILTIVS